MLIAHGRQPDGVYYPSILCGMSRIRRDKTYSRRQNPRHSTFNLTRTLGGGMSMVMWVDRPTPWNKLINSGDKPATAASLPWKWNVYSRLPFPTSRDIVRSVVLF